MPDVVAWLRNHVGLRLPDDELQAVLDFVLLYSLFERFALDENGGPSKIIDVVGRWRTQGRLGLAPFEASLAHFKTRHFPNGQESEHFTALRLRNADRQRVARVLRGEVNRPEEVVIAVLLVVNRLRNNLMHGDKWAYRLAGQGDNFRNANAALIAALECNGRFQ